MTLEDAQSQTVETVLIKLSAQSLDRDALETLRPVRAVSFRSKAFLPYPDPPVEARGSVPSPLKQEL